MRRDKDRNETGARQPGSPPGSIQQYTVRENHALEELARVFYLREKAIMLARLAGIPRERIPIFRDPLTFWTHVFEEANDGLLCGGVQPILKAAVAMYPNNPVFRDGYRASSRRRGAEGPRMTVFNIRGWMFLVSGVLLGLGCVGIWGIIERLFP